MLFSHLLYDYSQCDVKHHANFRDRLKRFGFRRPYSSCTAPAAGYEGRSLPARDEEAHIVFDHVSFTYPDGTSVLKEIDFSLVKGQTLGIIGATGGGKSTIVRLLLRLYDPTNGQIRINGRDIRSLDPEELHQYFGIVLQKTSFC